MPSAEQKILEDVALASRFRVAENESAPDPSIRHTYFGGSEVVTLAEFARYVVQDDELAVTVATAMLGGHDPYPWNDGDPNPRFFAEFQVENAYALREQLKEIER